MRSKRSIDGRHPVGPVEKRSCSERGRSGGKGGGAAGFSGAEQIGRSFRLGPEMVSVIRERIFGDQPDFLNRSLRTDLSTSAGDELSQNGGRA